MECWSNEKIGRQKLSAQTTTQEILLPDGDDWIARVTEKAHQNMKRYDGCAQVIADCNTAMGQKIRVLKPV